MKFDDALGLLGGFGRYQLLVTVVWNVFASGNGWQYTLTVFIAGRMDHWCKVPELQHLNETMQKLIAIPQTTGPLGDTVYKQCSMFNYNYSAINFTDSNTIDSWMRNETISEIACNSGWVFDKSVRDSTAVSQYELVCENDWMYTLPATFQMVGLLFGSFIAGLMSDKFGRKPTTIGMALCAIVAIIGGAFSDNFYLFLAMRWLSLLASIGANTSCWILCLEMMQPVHRAHVTLYSAIVRILRALVTLTAFFVRGHKWLQIISALVTIPGLVGVFFLSESPRWLIARGRYQEAENVSRRVAKINKINLPDDFTLIDDVTTKEQHVSDGPAKKVLVIDLLRTPNMRKRTLVISFQWFAVVFGSYAMSLNVGTLIPGNIYLNNLIINGVSNLLSPIILLIALFKMGRKSIIISLFIVNGVLALSWIGLLLTKIVALTTTIAMCGTLLINTAFRVIYLYSGEIFPTPARNVGLGSVSSFGRIGGLISPNIPLLGNIWYGLPYLTLGIFPLIAGALGFLLPETKDKQLPETFIEAELFGTGRATNSKEKAMRDSEPGSVDDNCTNHYGMANSIVDDKYDKIENDRRTDDGLVNIADNKSRDTGSNNTVDLTIL
ncbi:unnamed protein product [Owenia fusiformis]|uniref:Uncharacterized protein n=1 Tax=Owenia fusiformis TaxID=6347 RepID=A0A8J1TH01_OWEFU|nr:unnamed protein product [Owenia fusiformis]